jgi:dienelactone hydrolase
VGESEGTYELPDGSHDNRPHMLRRAGDVRAAMAALKGDARIDPERVGLIGGSQAGWVIPMACAEGGVAFAVILSGGATAFSRENLFSELTGELGSHAEAMSVAEALRRVRAHPQRDPDFRSELAAVRCPTLWLYGDQDRSNPTALCVEEIEAVRAETGNDFTVKRWPGSTHALLVGLYGGGAEALTLDSKVPRLYPVIGEWLAEKGMLAPRNAPK